MGLEIPRQVLAEWAASKPTIKALYVFGSYARGEARPDSDLDLALEFLDVDEPSAELIVRAATWKAELSQLTGITVTHLYRSDDQVAQAARVQIFSR